MASKDSFHRPFTCITDIHTIATTKVCIKLMFLWMSVSEIGTSLLCFYFYLLCFAAVLLKSTYCAQHYAQEQELSDYYGAYIQFCMSNSLHVTENFIKAVLLK